MKVFSAELGHPTTHFTRDTYRRYALADVRLERISSGHSTQNYHAVDRSGSEVFVKVYPEGWDVRAEQHAIALTRWAGDHGVPRARLRESMDGELLACSGRWPCRYGSGCPETL